VRFGGEEVVVAALPDLEHAAAAAADEAFGDFTYRMGWPAVKAFMDSYKPGDWKKLPDPFAPALLPTPSASVGIDADLLAKVQAAAASRGLDAPTLLDMIMREALEE
jgi:sulfite reductase (ferredoxin)